MQEVAKAICERFVNRSDCYGAYGSKGGYTCKDPVTDEVLERHKRGETIGLHSTDPETQTCKWAALDYDNHGDERDPAVHRAAMGAFLELREMGANPMFEDSNGKGGYHIWLFFDAPVPAASAYALMRKIAEKRPVPNEKKNPECFPKQPRVREGGYGNWLRLPGKHHKEDHWSKLFTSSGWVPAEWDIIETWPTCPLNLLPATPSSVVPGALVPGIASTDATLPKHIHGGGEGVPRNDTLERLPGVVAHLSAERADDYEAWIQVGQAIHDTDSTERGLETWGGWSKQSPKWKAGECAEKWRTFTKGGGLTFASLVRWEREDSGFPEEVHDQADETEPRPVPSLDDLGALDDLIWCFGDRVRFDEARVSYFFRDGVWDPEMAGPLIDEISQRSARQRQEWARKRANKLPEGKLHDDARKALRTFARRGVSSAGRNAHIKDASKDRRVYVNSSEFDKDPLLMAAPNGVIDLRDGSVRPGTPRDMITMRVAAPYDPTATCPRFERAIREWWPRDEKVQAFVWRFLGYSLLGRVPERKALILQGAPRCGKNTLTNTLLYVLGTYGDATTWKAFAGSDRALTPSLYKIRRKRFITSSESSPDGKWRSDTFKAFVAGDPMECEAKFIAPITFTPRGTLVMSTNFLPSSPVQDSAIYDRLVVVPMLQQFPVNDDATLADDLRAEAPGILARLVRECLAYQNAGGLPSIPKACADALRQAMQDDDPLRPWLDSWTLEPGRAAWLTSQSLHRHYGYCMEDLGYKDPLPHGRRFRAAMRKHFQHGDKSAHANKSVYLIPGPDWNVGDAVPRGYANPNGYLNHGDNEARDDALEKEGRPPFSRILKQE